MGPGVPGAQGGTPGPSPTEGQHKASLTLLWCFFWVEAVWLGIVLISINTTHPDLKSTGRPSTFAN